MLMQNNCIRNMECSDCDFKADCLMRRIMYSPFDIRPRFVNDGESAGYIIECEDYRTQVKQGEIIECLPVKMKAKWSGSYGNSG